MSGKQDSQTQGFDVHKHKDESAARRALYRHMLTLFHDLGESWAAQGWDVSTMTYTIDSALRHTEEVFQCGRFDPRRPPDE
jgi:hypothetical protein